MKLIIKKDTLYLSKVTGQVNSILSNFLVPSKRMNHLIQINEILLNNKPTQPEAFISQKDQLSIQLYENSNYTPIFNDLDIVFEDDHYLIINKQPNVLIHDEHQSLCQFVSSYYERIGIHRQVRFSNRLDFETSGLVIFSKHWMAATLMDQLVANRQITKHYLAITQKGIPSKGTINTPISSDRHHKSRQVVSKNGKQATTHYHVLDENDDYCLVEVEIETGRKHQIRVHLCHIGFPIIGDKLYGSLVTTTHLMLHAKTLKFVHPFTNEQMVIDTMIPNEFKIKMKKGH